MKICSKCQTPKDVSEFFVKDKKVNRLHAQCKDCYKEHRKQYQASHYLKYKEEYLERARKRRKELRNEFRTKMLLYLSGKRCVICKESDIRTFEFDHIDPRNKKFSISQAVRLGFGWEDVVIELEKCRILCANCHKKHTASQAAWYKDI